MRASTDSRVLIVTPTYNERDNLAKFVEGVLHVVPHADILIVDDASPDGTGQLADDLASSDRRVRVLHRGGKLGLGTAYLEAFRFGLEEGYDFIFEMDTDLSHDPRHLPAFFSAFAEGADVVIGSRNIAEGRVEGWGPLRHLISRGGSLYSRALLGLRIRDLTSGYKAFRSTVLETIELDRVRSEGYAFQIELTYRAVRRGFKVHEVPITFVDRRAGASKMSSRVFVEAVIRVPALRIANALHKL